MKETEQWENKITFVTVQHTTVEAEFDSLSWVPRTNVSVSSNKKVPTLSQPDQHNNKISISLYIWVVAKVLEKIQQ